MAPGTSGCARVLTRSIAVASPDQLAEEAGRGGLDAAVERERPADDREPHATRPGHDPLYQREEQRSRGREAIALDGPLARAPAECRRLVRMVEESPDAVGQRRHVAGRRQQAAALDHLGDHRHARRDERPAQRHARRRAWPAPDRACPCVSRWGTTTTSAASRYCGTSSNGMRPTTRSPAHVERSRRAASPSGSAPTSARITSRRPRRATAAARSSTPLYAARRAEEHHDPLSADAEPPPRLGGSAAPGFQASVSRTWGMSTPPKRRSKEARGHRDPVGTPAETLHQPRPRQAARIGEVEAPAHRSPEAAAEEEADLPVVHVEQQRPSRRGRARENRLPRCRGAACCA